MLHVVTWSLAEWHFHRYACNGWIMTMTNIIIINCYMTVFCMLYWLSWLSLLLCGRKEGYVFTHVCLSIFSSLMLMWTLKWQVTVTSFFEKVIYRTPVTACSWQHVHKLLFFHVCSLHKVLVYLRTRYCIVTSGECLLTGACNCQSCVDEKANEDLQHGFSDDSSRLVQTSDNRIQSIYLIDHVKVDTCNQLDTDMHIQSSQHKLTCFVCNRTFRYAGTLKKHLHLHAAEPPFSCKVCGKAFTSSGHLKRHLHSHIGKQSFSCKVCGRAYTRSGYLNVHMRSHTGERPLSCKVSSKDFVCSSKLNHHVHSHTEERPFSCQVCGQAFTSSGYLSVHMRSHTAERTLSCKVSSKDYVFAQVKPSHAQLHGRTAFHLQSLW